MTIYQYLNWLPERLVDYYKLFSRRTSRYKSMIMNRNKVAHLLSITKKSGDQRRFDYLSSLIYGVNIYDFDKLMNDIANDKDLTYYDNTSFIVL